MLWTVNIPVVQFIRTGTKTLLSNIVYGGSHGNMGIRE